MAQTVTEIRNAPLGPFNGKLLKIVCDGTLRTFDTGINAYIKGVIQMGGNGGIVTSKDLGSWVLNSNDGTEGSKTGQLYSTHIVDVTNNTEYVWVLF